MINFINSALTKTTTLIHRLFFLLKIIESVTVLHTEENTVYTVPIGGILIEVDKTQNLRIKNLNMLIFDYQYGFFGGVADTPTSHLYLEAVNSTLAISSEIFQQQRKIKHKVEQSLRKEPLLINYAKEKDIVESSPLLLNIDKGFPQESFWMGDIKILPL